jgi:hypothetical protein
MKVIAIGALALLAGCGELTESTGVSTESSDEAYQADSEPLNPPDYVEKLINGQFTQERPEVGTMLVNGGMCTATLIRRNVAITAAHCVDYRTTDQPGRNLGRLTLEVADGTDHVFPIDGYKSYSRSNEPGTKDVALLRLAQPVPSSVARPTGLATRFPVDGEQVRWMGYGCGRRGFSDGNSGRKQQIIFGFRGTDNSCPGDSGGPSFLGLDGPVFRVTSGYYTNGGGDIFGDVIAVRDRLVEQADVWSAAYPEEEQPDDGGDVTPQPDGGPAVPDAPTETFPDIVQTYLRGKWVAVEWLPVPNAEKYALLLIGRGAGGKWGYTARFDAGKDTGRQSRYVWLSATALCNAMPEETRGSEILLSAEVRPNDEKPRARRRPVPQPLACPL